MMYSVVIPIYNEEEVLPELYKRLTAVMETLGAPYEVIFVDDGSTDRSFHILENLHRTNRSVKVIKFSRNFGQHIAITAGLDYAAGDVVILMDGDLQNRPEDIPSLIAKINKGYDIVYTIRKGRKDPFLKRVNSQLFTWIMKRIVRDPIAIETSIFRAMRKNVIEAVRELRERNRFIVGIIDWTGFQQTSITVMHDRRFAGKTKYPFYKQFHLALDAIFAFSTFPLQLASIFGFFITLVAFGFGAYIIVRTLLWGVAIPGFASVIVSLFFLSGVQLTLLGIIGAYIGRIYNETKQRPLYIVEKRLE